MKTVEISDLKSQDLKRRILLNYQRMSSPLYRYPEVFEQTDGWPGDFVGRCLLSLISLYYANDDAEIKDKIIDQIEEIFEHIPEYTNEDKYFGPIFNGEYVNEQQVAGNSWYLRGLVGYYKLTGNPKALEYIKSIVHNFLYKVGPFYEHYPLNKRILGEVAGTFDGNVNNGWKTSTDVGCAFIMVDGATDVLMIVKCDRLKNQLAKIIDKFMGIDYVSLECQTHATLSCVRGILRFYEFTGEKKYLDFVISALDSYVKNGLTYDYANINLYKHPETWTEPCAIIDSFILAKKLYEHTGEEKYLQLFNRILTNSLRTFQRDNGGAGCSTCAYEERGILKMHLYEAFFCCTMRLGEGLKEIKDFVFKEKEDGIYINSLVDITHIDKDLEMDILLDVYNHSEMVIDVKKLTKPEVLYIYIPRDMTVDGYEKWNSFIKVDVKEEGKIKFTYKLLPIKEGKKVLYGDILLSRKPSNHEGQTFDIDGATYSIIYDNSKFSEEELKKVIQYIY